MEMQKLRNFLCVPIVYSLYCEHVEVQTLDHIPEKIVIEAKVIGGEVLGICVCAVNEAK